MKRFISLFISVVLVASSAFVASAKNEAIDVTLSMYCNLSDKKTVNGKYMDNIFYVSVDTLCDLADATVTEQNNDKVCITVARDSRNCEIFFDSQTLTEEYIGDQSITMPCFKENGKAYISALHFLRCLGADVIIDKNNNPQFVVCFQYNFFEAITEYVNNDLGNFFYWDEIDFGEKDIEDVLVNAGVVALINRDSNIFKMAINPRGIEREALEEVLAVIVKNEGQETFSENDPLLKEIGLANDFLGIELGVFDILKGAEVLDLPDNFNDFVSAETTGISTVVNLLNALDTMKQFENVSETQKKLLKDTVLTYKDDSPMLCGDWKNIYKAAENVDLRIQNDYTNEFAASCDAAEKTAYTFLDQATGNPVSLAWSCLVYAGKIVGSNIIDKKTQLYNAYNCSMIQYAANELLTKPCADLTDNDHFYFNLSNQQYCYTRAKNSLILQLKSTISTRQYLVASQFLSDSYKKDMEEMIRETAVLLNKVENCKIIPIGVDPVVKEDLTWMEETLSIESTDKHSETESFNLVANDGDFSELEEILKEIGDTIDLTGYDSGSSQAYKTLLSAFLGPFYVSPIYTHYFEYDDIVNYYSNGVNFAESSDSKKDPLGRFLNSYSYGKVPANNIDWIIENIFNVKPDRNNADIYNDYNGAHKIYYYNDYYYFVLGDAGFLGVVPEIVSKQVNKDNSYTIRYNLFMEDEYGDFYGSYETVCALKEIDGKRQWTFTSIKDISQKSGEQVSGEQTSNSDDCYDAYEDVLEEYLAKWSSGEMYSYRAHIYHDIDEDGINEMIIHDGTCEQDRTYYFYGYRDGEAILLGTVNGWHANLADSEKSLVISSGMGGEGDYYYIQILGNEITETYGGAYNFPPSPYFGEEIIFMND